MSEERRTLQAQLQYLLDLDIPDRLEPEQRLLLAVLRQAVIDYFGDDPLEKASAVAYFAESPLYQITLRLFRLPDDLLPAGVDIGRGRVEMPLDPIRLETLVHELSGTQLKVMLTLGLLELPATAGRISKECRVSRGTAIGALGQLAEQGMVVAVDTSQATIWTVPSQVRQFLDATWAAVGREVMLPDVPGLPSGGLPADPAAGSTAE